MRYCSVFADHVELLLELLVGVVDAELLEAVDLKGLKPVVGAGEWDRSGDQAPTSGGH